MRTTFKVARLLVALAALTSVLSCAWFQKNESKLVCAAEGTIQDAPQLLAIVNGCTTIAVSVENIVPCILAAAGSQWTEDTIACFTAAQATATATGTAPALAADNRTKLKEAVKAKWGPRLGW